MRARIEKEKKSDKSCSWKSLGVKPVGEEEAEQACKAVIIKSFKSFVS